MFTTKGGKSPKKKSCKKIKNFQPIFEQKNSEIFFKKGIKRNFKKKCEQIIKLMRNVLSCFPH